MKIYFPSVSYQEYTFIWDYDDLTKKAICNFELWGATKAFETRELIEHLRQFEGIRIHEDPLVAKIDDMETFLAAHPKKLVRELRKFESFVDQRTSAFPWFRARAQTQFERHSRMISLEESQMIAGEKFTAQGIWIDRLIEREGSNPSLWSNTLVYESYFTEKTTADKKKRCECFIKAPTNFFVELQYEKNEALYPIKARQISTLRAIFDNYLAPLYSEFAVEEITPPAFKQYCQNLIEQIMLGEGIAFPLKKPVDLDLELFYQQADVIDKIPKKRLEKIDILLRGFYFFLNDRLSNDLSRNKEVCTRLDLLRSAVKSNEAIMRSLGESILFLRQLMLDSAQVQFEFGLKEEHLSKELDEKRKTIRNFYSFSQLMDQVLIIKLPRAKKITIQAMNKQILDEIVKGVRMLCLKNIHSKNHIANLAAGKDFYISPTAALAIFTTLEQTIYSCSSKKPIVLIQMATGTVNKFIEEELNRLIDEGLEKEALSCAFFVKRPKKVSFSIDLPKGPGF